MTAMLTIIMIDMLFDVVDMAADMFGLGCGLHAVETLPWWHLIWKVHLLRLHAGVSVSCVSLLSRWLAFLSGPIADVGSLWETLAVGLLCAYRPGACLLGIRAVVLLFACRELTCFYDL